MLATADVSVRMETDGRMDCEVMDDPKVDPFFSPKNLEALRQSIQQAEEGDLYTFGSVEELDEFAREKLRGKVVNASSVQ